MVIPYLMQAWWLDVMFGSNSPMWQAISAKRRHIVTEQARTIPPTLEEEVARLRALGTDVYAKAQSNVAAQAAPLPFNNTALHAVYDTREDWGAMLSRGHQQALRARQPREAPPPAPPGMMEPETFTLDYDRLREDADEGRILHDMSNLDFY